MEALGEFHFVAGGSAMQVMPTVTDIRHVNLLALIDHFGSIQALANVLDRSHSQISQLKTRSAHSTSSKPRAIGDDLARWIELRCNLPRGWMDMPHDGRPVPSAAAMEIANSFYNLDAQAQAAVRAILERLQAVKR